MKRLAFIRNFPLGLLLGWIAALLLVWVIDGEANDQIARNWTYLFTVVASLTAASIALSGSLAAISSQNDNLAKARNDDLRSARAVLPLVISELYQMSERMFEFSLNDPTFFTVPSNQELMRNFLVLKDNTTQVLRDCIKSSDLVSSDWLGLLIANFQIFSARTESLFEAGRLVTSHNRASLALDWAIQLAVAEHCFEYARGKVPSVPLRLSPATLHLPIGSVHFATSIYHDANDLLSRVRPSFHEGDAAFYSEA